MGSDDLALTQGDSNDVDLTDSFSTVMHVNQLESVLMGRDATPNR